MATQETNEKSLSLTSTFGEVTQKTQNNGNPPSATVYVGASQSQAPNNGNYQAGPHRHIYGVEGNYLKCSICGKQKLNLKNTSERGILTGVKSDGKNYRVREDRKRYLFPGEWFKFIAMVPNLKHKLFYMSTIHTGGRALEVLHLKAKDFDFERSTITFRVVKQRVAKKNFAALGKTRTFFVSDKFMKEVKKYIKDLKDPDTYLFMDGTALPGNYENLTNSEKKKYYGGYVVSYNQMLKRKLKKAGIQDWNQFSLHNLRKTYGNWMRIFDIKTEEICYRLGHDMNTYIAHYGSPLIFTPQERQDILSIYGQIR